MKMKFKLITVVLLISLLFCGFKSGSDEVDDGADIFTDAQEQKLNDAIHDLEDDLKCQIVIATVEDSSGYSNEYLAEQYFDDNNLGYEGSNGSSVLMFINMDSSNRGVSIEANKEAGDVIPQSEMETFIDGFYDELVDGEYYEAATIFVDQVNEYYDDYNMSFFERASQNILYELLGALIISAIVIFIMVRSNKAKMTVNNHTYLKNNDYQIHDRRDMFINTTVVTRKINTNNGGGGSHGGGGGGHSSGSRSF